MQAPVFEILTWRSALNVKDSDIIGAMTRFSGVVERLSGFLHQSLYKNQDQQWVCIYFWKTQEEAHASNEAVAHTREFSELMSLIEKESVTMEVLLPSQHSGDLVLWGNCHIKFNMNEYSV